MTPQMDLTTTLTIPMRPTTLTNLITVTHQMTPMDPITVMTPTIQMTLNTNTYFLPFQAHHLFRKLRRKEITNLRKCRIKLHLCIRAYRRLRKFVEVLKEGNNILPRKMMLSERSEFISFPGCFLYYFSSF